MKNILFLKMFHQEIALHDIINQYFFIICFQCTKYGKETIPRPFSKKSKLSISLDQYSKVLSILFYCLPSWGLFKMIETKLQTTCFYLIYGFFKKQKEAWNYSPRLIFYMIFVEIYFCWNILLPDQSSMSGCLYFVRYWAICVF